RAQKTIPGGVNSPVRAFRAVGGTPPFIVRGKGSRIWDADGREYLDYVGSWGPLVLGHADREVVAAVREAAGHGLSFGAPTEREIEMAELLARFVPGLDAAFHELGDSIACVIVEPVAGNMNLIAPRPGFLQRIREHCTRHGAVLIFDEVMTGFRVGLQGAQQLYGVRADLVTLGKIIGGGMPLGAFGGRRDIMEKIAPLGPV